MLDYKDIKNGVRQSVLEEHSDRLADSIDRLSVKIDAFLDYSTSSIPNKVVYLIFVLVFSLIFGIEGLQFIFKTWLPKLMLQ